MKKMASIGFDLDNTIIDYSLSAKQYAQQVGIQDVFSLGELRKILNGIDHAHDAWTRAQSWIYGEGLQFAAIQENLTTQLTRLHDQDFSIFVVSHKTEYGPKSFGSVEFVNLALEWLNSSPLGSLLTKNVNLFFEETRELKLKRIRNLQLNFFVDDLIEVLEDALFPRETIGIHFCEESTSSRKETRKIVNFSDLNELVVSYG